jgi:hypothetical protein
MCGSYLQCDFTKVENYGKSEVLHKAHKGFGYTTHKTWITPRSYLTHEHVCIGIRVLLEILH